MHAKAHKRFLLFLLDTVPTQAKLILRHLTPPQYLAIREVSVNLLRGSFKVTQKQLSQLKKHKQFYRQLARGGKVKLLQHPTILLLQAAKQTIEQL